MASKYLTYGGLAYFIEKIRGIFAPLVHTHTLSQVTDAELTADSEADLVVPIESETLEDIANGEYESDDTAMFTGNSQYTPLTSAEIDALVATTLAAMQPAEEE